MAVQSFDDKDFLNNLLNNLKNDNTNIIKVIINDSIVKVNRIILMSISEYFKALISDTWNNDKCEEIKLEVDDEFKNILLKILDEPMNKIKIDRKNYLVIYENADYFGLKKLKREVELYFKRKEGRKYSLEDINESENILCRLQIQYFCSYPSKYFSNSNFYGLSEKVVLDMCIIIFNKNFTYASSYIKFYKYLFGYLNNRKHYFNDVKDYIRWDKMDLEDIRMFKEYYLQDSLFFEKKVLYKIINEST